MLKLEDRQLLVLSLSFFFVFLAFSTTQNLESSLNEDNSLGTIAIGTVYVVLTVGSVVAPTVIGHVGVKRSIIGGLGTYGLFIATHLYMRWWTVMPAAVLLGFGASVLWGAHGVYLSGLAPTENLATRASGIFFGIFQSSQLVGNVIAFGVLGSDDSATGTSDVPESTVRVLFAVFTISACIGTSLSLRLIGLNKLHKHQQECGSPLNQSRRTTPINDVSLNSEITNTSIPFAANDHEDTTELLDENLMESLEQDEVESSLTMINILFHDRDLRILLPLFFYSGMESAFAWADFTGDVVKPVLGEKNVPLVMIGFGVANALVSLFMGRLAGKSKFLLVLACVLQLSVVFLTFTVLDLDHLKTNDLKWFWLFMMSVILGYADATLNTLVTAMLATKYKRVRARLAFSHFKLWQSLATGAAFFYSSTSISLEGKCWIVGISGILSLFALICTKSE